MKKNDRNCGIPPYPMYGGMMPNMMPMFNDPMYMTNTLPQTNNTQLNTYDDLQKQINNLDRRITKLESTIKDGTTYNSFSETNYHVM